MPRDIPSGVTYLSAAIASLAAAGADFAIISANTPHIVFDELQALSPIPLLSIVEATCQAAKALHLHRLALIGTRFTMKGDFYPRVFSREGIELIVPGDQEQDYIHEIYLGELLKGTFLPETRQKVCQIVERLVHDHRIQGAILAGTELPLLLGDVTAVAGVPFLDTTQIHVRAGWRNYFGEVIRPGSTPQAAGTALKLCPQRRLPHLISTPWKLNDASPIGAGRFVVERPFRKRHDACGMLSQLESLADDETLNRA